MNERSPRNPIGRAFAAAAVLVCLVGFFNSTLGAWTAVTGAVWLAGTQRPLRGFILIAIGSLIGRLLTHWHRLQIPAAQYAAWIIPGVLISVFPYLLHRLASRRLNGLLSTLPLPVAAVLFQALGRAILPAGAFPIFSLVQTQSANMPLMQLSAVAGTPAIVFLIAWLAALLNWMWDYDFRTATIAPAAAFSAAIFTVAFGYGFFRQFIGRPITANPQIDILDIAACRIAGLALGAAALLSSNRPKPWAQRTDLLPLLRSPHSAQPLHLLEYHGRESLATVSGESFPIHNGIPNFLAPADLTGPNLKYNQLYEAIGGFYDSIQKFGLALLNVNRDYLIHSGLRQLEIKPGDRVLETSVGTGLMLNALPRGAHLFGLDIAAEMLANCQTNLRRWNLHAELFRGNAEALPFADDTFDVVYHVGAINFFSDRARAIREMIRVAKPGTLILISDETEKHVKDTYETMPIGGVLYKNRPAPVSAPMDLVPPEMQEIQLQTIFGGRGYVLTFRKPAV